MPRTRSNPSPAMAVCRLGRGLAALLAVTLLAACASTPRSTRMTVADFNDMAEDMAQSLLRSPAVAARSPGSEPWLIAIDRVVNLTEDVMTADEQWAILAMLRGSTSIVNLRHVKNMRFVEQRSAMPDLPGGVTHTMTAMFRNVARTATDARADYYYCEFQLLDLRTGEPMWQDKFEFKRAAEGNLWD